MICESTSPPFRAPKQPKASPEKRAPADVSNVTMVSGQCTMGIMAKRSSRLPRLSVSPSFTRWVPSAMP